MEKKKKSDKPETQQISDPELPVVSGAVVPPEAEGEQARLGMDRNRALLLLASQQHGTGISG